MRRIQSGLEARVQAPGGVVRSALVVTATVLLTFALLPAPTLAQQAGPVSTSVTVSWRGAELEIEEADGTSHHLALRDGAIQVDGQSVGSYEKGGALERSWRELLQQGMDLRPEAFAARLRSWSPPAGGAESGGVTALTDALARFAGESGVAREAPAAETAPKTAAQAGTAAAGTVTVRAPGGGTVSIAPGQLSVDQLTSRLEKLRTTLGRLGSQVQNETGDLALVVHDDYAIPRGQVIDGNLALLNGDLRLGGQVDGDILVLDGTLSLEPSAVVRGDIVQVGGTVARHGGKVEGEFLSVKALTGQGAVVAGGTAHEAPHVPAVPRIRVRHSRGFVGSIVHNIFQAVGGVLGTLTALLLLGVVGALTVYFLKDQLEIVADTARGSFARSFGVGLAGEFLFFPVLLILVAGVITWLVIPFYILAFGLALLAGYLAVAHATGEVLAQQRYRYKWIERLRRSNSYYYVFSGLAVLLLPFALAAALELFGGWLSFLRGLTMFVAVSATWVAITAGLGAAILARGGRVTEHARPTSTSGGTEAAS
jgi:hypothetical protein